MVSPQEEEKVLQVDRTGQASCISGFGAIGSSEHVSLIETTLPLNKPVGIIHSWLLATPHYVGL